ncbi:MAG TPA: helix-turn-helix domain-containing protein [Candidatus Competibacteraceae bacterium]|nr:helix-turn-helix domain-containing protein [Candidatus Competibacteraceae bacterium]HRZ04656.1 helix-turn-helix domain-containing protein [Candidatus Competibacteraceae bacterium]HSA44921.1 helix-turn-helix domain-containing protein [Candidatus Competibacteraceae bacterium]
MIFKNLIRYTEKAIPPTPEEPIMPRRQLVLSETERRELVQLRDHARQPYQRERAAALLKIADGMPAALVARHGLLRPRRPDTVYAWLDRYQATGGAGLKVHPGRGRKPAFSPSAFDGGGPHRMAIPLPA